MRPARRLVHLASARAGRQCLGGRHQPKRAALAASGRAVSGVPDRNHSPGDGACAISLSAHVADRRFVGLRAVFETEWNVTGFMVMRHSLLLADLSLPRPAEGDPKLTFE